MKPKDFKDLKNELKEAFRNILSNCYTEFIEVDISNAIGQIFTINAFYGEQYINENRRPIEDVNIVRPLMSFQASGTDGIWKNEILDINRFFNTNDEVFNEFYEMGERQELNSLTAILKKGLNHSLPRNVDQSTVDSYFFISIESSIQGGNQFLRELLNEGIATIGYEDNSISVGCSQSERTKITALVDGGPVNLRIPFDKVDNFQTFQKETEQSLIDEKYIFVAMSFQNSPELEDTYSTIQRTIKKVRKGLKCERVDNIQDDFIINDKIIDCIKKSKLLIVDLTGNRPNVYYELGYARALGKQVILLCRKDEKPHFDVVNQNTIFYTNSTMLENSLTIRLRACFR
jgi:hypothetical protein